MAEHNSVADFAAAIQTRVQMRQEALIVGLRAVAEDFAASLRKYMPTLSGDAAGGVSVRLSGMTVEVVLTGARYVVEGAWVENPKRAPHTGAPGHMHSSQELARMKKDGRPVKYNSQAKVKPWVAACDDVGLRFIDLKSVGGTWHIVAEPTAVFIERIINGL